MRKKQSIKSWKKTLQIHFRAWKLLYQKCPQMLVSRLLYVIWTALSPYVGIYLSALFIDELVGQKDVERLWFLVMLTLVSGALISLGSALLYKWKETFNAGLEFFIEEIYSEKLLSMDYVNLDETKYTELLSTIRQNQNHASWGLLIMVSQCEELCSYMLQFLGGIFLTVSLFQSKVPENAGVYTLLNHPLCIFVLMGIIFGITYLVAMLHNKGKSYMAQIAEQLNYGNRLFSFFGWMGTVRSLALDVRIYRQDLICEKYNLKKDNPFGSKGILAKYLKGPSGCYLAASKAVSHLFLLLAYVFVCLKAWAGAFGLGAVTQYVASIMKVSEGLSKFLSSLGDMKNNCPFLEMVFEFLDIPNSMYQGSLTVEKRQDRNYEIEFRNVSFKYPGSDQYALRNVNMKFEIGKCLAVVGMNGSGKTTFIKLLCRLYDPTEGEILLNGIDIRKYNYQEYLSIFSVVFQDFHLLSFQLGENVATQVEYQKEKVTDALKKAGFDSKNTEKVMDLETYLYTDYNKDGVNISGGEAQKIAIARAIYKDAPFMILDEPTAALDPIAEAEIYSKFNEIAGNRTAIYISHRLSSCKFCDEILVFHNGTVIQKGTHQQLLTEEQGKYYELWHAQAQYYTE